MQLNSVFQNYYYWDNLYQMDRMDEKHPVFEQLFLSDFNTWSFSA